MTSEDITRVRMVLESIKPPRGGAGKVSVTFTLNFAPSGVLHRMQYGILEESDVPPLAKSQSVR
jgi:hypothetical protein